VAFKDGRWRLRRLGGAAPEQSRSAWARHLSVWKGSTTMKAAPHAGRAEGLFAPAIFPPPHA
jgi:hypothetical protein